MHPRRLIIDGYSLLYRNPDLAALRGRDLMLARRRLVRRVEEVADALAEQITIVFDGRQAGPGEEFQGAGVEVVFSPAHQTADTVIERMVFAAPRPEEIIVVTSDRGESDTVTAAGAECMSCEQFLDECAESRSRAARRMRPAREEGPTLGDFFPEA